MRFEPADWHLYDKKQKSEWSKKSFEERQEIIKVSYLPMITDSDNNLNIDKLLQVIMGLQDEVVQLKYDVERLENQE